jgi:hypothetical protein
MVTGTPSSAWNAVVGPGGPQWTGWDAARDCVVTDWTNGKGYVLDLYGGHTQFGGATVVYGFPFKQGADCGRRHHCLDPVALRFWVIWDGGQAYEFVSSGLPTVIAGAGVNEVQTVTITGSPTGGTFTLTHSGQTTASIAYNATAATVQTRLQALSNIGSGNVTVTGGPGPGTPYAVTFVGALGTSNVAQMTATSSLTGGASPAVTPATYMAGVPGTPTTSVTSTCRPTLAWSSGDPDNNVQIQWQLYVYTQSFAASNNMSDPSAWARARGAAAGHLHGRRHHRLGGLPVQRRRRRHLERRPRRRRGSDRHHHGGLGLRHPLGVLRRYRAFIYKSSPRYISPLSNVATAQITRLVYALASTADATLGGEVFVVDTPQWKRSAQAGVFTGIAAKYPVVVSDGTPKTRTQTLGLECDRREQWDLVDALITADSTLCFRDPFGDVTYCRIVGDFSRQQQWFRPYPDEVTPLRHNHKVTIPLVEVAPPLVLDGRLHDPAGPGGGVLMYPLSGAARQALAQSHTMASKLEVLHGGYPVYTLVPYSGTVNTAAGRSVMRNLGCTVIDPTGQLSGSESTTCSRPTTPAMAVVAWVFCAMIASGVCAGIVAPSLCALTASLCARAESAAAWAFWFASSIRLCASSYSCCTSFCVWSRKPCWLPSSPATASRWSFTFWPASPIFFT